MLYPFPSAYCETLYVFYQTWGVSNLFLGCVALLLLQQSSQAHVPRKSNDFEINERVTRCVTLCLVTRGTVENLNSIGYKDNNFFVSSKSSHSRAGLGGLQLLLLIACDVSFEREWRKNKPTRFLFLKGTLFIFIKFCLPVGLCKMYLQNIRHLAHPTMH